MIQQAIKKRIEEAGMSISSLSKKTGLQKTQISRYLKGDADMLGRNIEKLANAINSPDAASIRLLKTEQLMGTMPLKLHFVRDSGLWSIATDDEEVLYEQDADETLMDFLFRVLDSII